MSCVSTFNGIFGVLLVMARTIETLLVLNFISVKNFHKASNN